MKKLNFRALSAKSFATAIMAIMSVLAVSCTADDIPSRSPEDKPDTDETVRLESSLQIEAAENYQKVDAADALIKLYKEKVGSTGVVTYQKTDGEISLVFKTTTTNCTAFKQALRSVSTAEIDNAVKMTKVISLQLTVTNVNEAVVKYTYTEKSIAGTWKYSKDGVDYTFQITDNRTSEGNYKASFTISGNKIEGVLYKAGDHYTFASNEKYTDVASLYAAIIRIQDSEQTKFSIDLVKMPFAYVFEYAIFTK